jgi:hypothetical protein
MERNNSYINKLVSFIQNRCDNNTLCLETCNYSNCFENIYEDSNEIKNYEQCIRVINDWRNKSELFENINIHSIVIKYTAKQNIMNKVRKVYPFTHGFNLININNNEFLFCDSWEAIHFMNCRTKTYNYEELYNLLVDILTPNNNIENIDNFFNDENKSNWNEEINRLKSIGEWTQNYDSTKILNTILSGEYFDIEKQIKIEVYQPKIIDGEIINLNGGKRRRNRGKTKKRIKIKRIKIKTNRKKRKNNFCKYN